MDTPSTLTELSATPLRGVALRTIPSELTLASETTRIRPAPAAAVSPLVEFSVIVVGCELDRVVESVDIDASATDLGMECAPTVESMEAEASAKERDWMTLSPVESAESDVSGTIRERTSRIARVSTLADVSVALAVY